MSLDLLKYVHLWLKVLNFVTGRFNRTKTAVECLQTSHNAGLISW